MFCKVLTPYYIELLKFKAFESSVARFIGHFEVDYNNNDIDNYGKTISF